MKPWRANWIAVTTASAVVTLSSTVLAHESGGHLERPEAQRGIDSSVTFIERTLTWPAGPGASRLAFRYRVDSEANYDFLVAYLDGVEKGRWSGLAKVGMLEVPATPGSHTVRFSYVKDGSVSHGLDLASIDEVRVLGADGSVVTHHLTSQADSAGWIAGGSPGAWSWQRGRSERALKRPISQAYSGYISSGTTSGIQRTIAWTGADRNRLGFRYFVESESGYDFFRVSVDGSVVFSVSGNRQGYEEVAVSPGSHAVKFEYFKDTSVDVGRDVAYVDRVVALGPSGPFESYDMAGYAVGGLAPGWSGVGGAGSWVIDAVEPARAYVNAQAFSAPVIDGVLGNDASEYPQPTVAHLVSRTLASATERRMVLRANAQTSTLFVNLRVPRHSDTGTVTLGFDAQRALTIKGFGCSAAQYGPSQDDRRIIISYAALGIPASTQAFGSCSGWVPIPSGAGDEWPVIARVTAPANDPGYLHIEASVVLRPVAAQGSEPFGSSLVGLFVKHLDSANTEELFFPFTQAGNTPDNDVSLWETIDFGSVPVPFPRLRITQIDAFPER